MPRKKKEVKGGKASPGIISRLTSGVVSKPADDITTPEPPPMSVRQLAEKRVADASAEGRAAMAEIQAEEEKESARLVAAKADRKHKEMFWPEGKEFPSEYPKRVPMPCPKCRRLYTEHGNQACYVTSSGHPKGMKDDVQLAFFRCRACEHRFSMVRGD